MHHPVFACALVYQLRWICLPWVLFARLRPSSSKRILRTRNQSLRLQSSLQKTYCLTLQVVLPLPMTKFKLSNRAMSLLPLRLPIKLQADPYVLSWRMLPSQLLLRLVVFVRRCLPGAQWWIQSLAICAKPFRHPTRFRSSTVLRWLTSPKRFVTWDSFG